MGRDLSLLIDMLIGHPEDEIAHHTSTYAKDLQACLERVHTFARSHMQLKIDSMKEHYDAGAMSNDAMLCTAFSLESQVTPVD